MTKALPIFLGFECCDQATLMDKWFVSSLLLVNKDDRTPTVTANVSVHAVAWSMGKLRVSLVGSLIICAKFTWPKLVKH